MSVLCHAALRMVTQTINNQSASWDKIDKLCAHSDKRDPADMLRRTLMAAFLLRCLVVAGYFGKQTEKENDCKYEF